MFFWTHNGTNGGLVSILTHAVCPNINHWKLSAQDPLKHPSLGHFAAGVGKTRKKGAPNVKWDEKEEMKNQFANQFLGD